MGSPSYKTDWGAKKTPPQSSRTSRCYFNGWGWCLANSSADTDFVS
jgi:hypothetical protein